ncbi:MAG TPA: TetR/AcrR family transcriptional regulator [Rhodanobacteraceae bacterium]|nr:TetR/AcrR family transcriptional regulator [Rhodanobacteraceae bacterium]
MPDAAPIDLAVPALERILAAAERLFAERGFDSVSISDVAAASGVCKANVFHHFAGKHALYEAVLSGSCVRLGEAMERMLATGADPAGQIPHFLTWYRAYLREHPATARLLLRELTGNPDLAESGPVFPVLVRLVDMLVAHVRAGSAHGVFREGIHPTVVASLLLGVTLFNAQTEHLRRHMAAWRDVGDDAYVALLTDVLLRGVLSAQALQTR